MKRKKGILISFEGGEGSGKTSQARLLYKFLLRKKLPTILVEEPGGTAISQEIRSILLKKKYHGNIFKETELLLFLASRAQLVREVIKPAIKQNFIVICDRFIDSTVAYQAYGRGIPMELIGMINDFSRDGIIPYLTILLDIDTKTGLARASSLKGGKDRIELENIKFQNNVRRGYLSIAKKNKKRFLVINGRYSMNEIKNTIQKRVMEIL